MCKGRCLIALLSLLQIAASAAPPSIVGTWQGVLGGPTGAVRRIMDITRNGDTYRVTIHSIDETDVPIVTRNVVVRGSLVTMKFDMDTDPWIDYHRVYRASLSADGDRLTGKWALPNTKPLDMIYKRVARETWPILEPRTQMVEVQPNISIETLDWGGTGRPLLLLAGLGNTGHDFFKIVEELKRRYHVYSMTRRGFGNSSKPEPNEENYSADRLGDDVIAVMNALHIEKPILVGHSIAGEELSDIGTRYPNAISALIYLDAGYWYAFDGGRRPPDAIPTPPPGRPPLPPIGKAVLDGTKDFSGPINVPILAVYAYPHDLAGEPKSERTPAKVAQANADDLKEIDRFAHGLPNAKIVKIPNANHFVYISNTAQVLDDINAFVAGLPPNKR